MKNEYGADFPDTDIYFNELAKSDLGNTEALNIEEFKTKANSSHGYYIGRYEARTAVKAERTEANKNNGAEVTVKKDDFVYNFVTQAESARLSRGMYKESKFTSDLMNSYAWDTAVVFLQTFDNRTNKTNPYSKQNSLNTGSLANKGTNNLEEITKQDKICNIWDMSSNCGEFTTENYVNSENPCTARGGSINYSYGRTRGRHGGSIDAFNHDCTFRPILYL